MDISIVVWVYGALVLIGGIMGWAKAKSVPSLVSGVIFGVALIVGGYFIRNGNPHGGIVFSAVLAALLLFIMGVRFAKSKKFMPAGLVAIMSLIVLILLVIKL